ncbi:MAG: hypothetical protein U5K69_19345 [Balneolaceae bacterium]|nr:hypothetical protein [Balneolaceae bacterium]
MSQSIVILGSTGSIGEQALDILREHIDRYRLLAISCNSNLENTGTTDQRISSSICIAWG